MAMPPPAGSTEALKALQGKLQLGTPATITDELVFVGVIALILMAIFFIWRNKRRERKRYVRDSA